MQEIRAAVKYPSYAGLVVLADGEEQVSGEVPWRSWVGHAALRQPLFGARTSPARNTLLSGSRSCRA